MLQERRANGGAVSEDLANDEQPHRFEATIRWQIMGSFFA
jgi:hypothetical protein